VRIDHRPRPGKFDLRWLAWAALGGLLLGLPAVLASCSHRREDPAERGRAVAADAEWAWLQTAKKTLDSRRAELALARKGGAGPGVADTATREKEVAALADELGRRLIDFINADPPVEGERLSGRRLAAVRMKSDEDIAVAREFIDRGGDFQRAIEIYEAALEVDPDNPLLQQALDSARASRYMTAERFAQVKKGMTLDEVKALVGQPNLRDVREFPDRGILAWFFTRDAEGRAAAVWFAKEKGTFTVYMADFHAIEVPEPAPAPAPPAAPSPVSGE